MSGLAGHGRTYIQLVDTQLVDKIGLAFPNQGSAGDKNFLFRTLQILLQYPTQNTFTQFDNNITTFNDRAQIDTLLSTAIVHVYHQIL